MASANLQLAAGPAGGGAHLAPSPSASSTALTVSPAGSMQFLEGSPSSLFWRPGASSREWAGGVPADEEHPTPPDPRAPSPPQLDLPVSGSRNRDGPPTPHVDQLRAGYFGLGLAYQQTSVRDTAGESPEPGNESDHGDADTARRVSVNALLSDSLLSLRQWWPRGTNKDRSNISLPVSVGYTESSVSGRVTPEAGTQETLTLAPSPELPAGPKLAPPKSLRLRAPGPISLPTIAGSPNMEVLRANRDKEPSTATPRRDREPESPTPQTAFFARRGDSSPTVKLVRDGSSLSRTSTLSDRSEYITPGQWVKRGSADMGIFDGGTRDSGVDVGRGARQPQGGVDWSRYQISPPPPARVSTSPQKGGAPDIYRDALPMEALVASSSGVPPVTPQKRRGLTINVMSPMSPTSPTSIMVVPPRELQPTSPTSIMLIPSRYQQDGLLPPLSARSSHFSFISNISARRGQRAPSRMESDAHLRPSSAAGSRARSGARIRPRSHLPTARTLFFLGFIAPWCWLLGGWLLDRSRPGTRNRQYQRSRRRQNGNRGAWDARHLAPAPDIDDLLQTEKADISASPVLPNVPHSTPEMGTAWQHSAHEPGDTDLELAGLQARRVDPWVVRCRIAAIISSFFILAGCIAALAIAFRVNRDA